MQVKLYSSPTAILAEWEGAEIPDDVFRLYNCNTTLPYFVSIDDGPVEKVRTHDPLGVALESHTVHTHKLHRVKGLDLRASL
jgi:hypothetical protein